MSNLPGRIPWGGQELSDLDAMQQRDRQVQPDMGPGRMDPTLPGGPAPAGTVPVKLPGANFPPAGALAVDELGDANIAPGTTALVLTIPVAETGQLRIDGIGFGADDEASLRFLSWTLFLDQDPTAYSNIGAAVGTVVQPSPIFLHVAGPRTVRLELTSAAAAILTYRFVARVKGWAFVGRGTP